MGYRCQLPGHQDHSSVDCPLNFEPVNEAPTDHPQVGARPRQPWDGPPSVKFEGPPEKIQLLRGVFFEELTRSCAIRVTWKNESDTAISIDIDTEMLVDLASALARSEDGHVSITPLPPGE